MQMICVMVVKRVIVVVVLSSGTKSPTVTADILCLSFHRSTNVSLTRNSLHLWYELQLLY